MISTLTALLTLAAPAQSAPWEPMFDGKTLNGWYVLGGKATYRVENGEIVGTTAPNTANTFLCSYRSFANFEMEFDFKVHQDLNSGVQIRSHSVPGFAKGAVHGYQCEIDPSPRSFTGAIYDESRKGDWIQDLSQNPNGRKAYKQGQWNKYRIRAIGDHLQTWINGVPCADVYDATDRIGFIGLQVHGVGDRKDPLEVRWKNIRVRDFGNPDLAPGYGGEWLLDQKGDMAKWQKANGQPIDWIWDHGFLEVKPGSGDILTRKKYDSYEMYIEFMVDDNGKTGQANGNSGVYMQGRYEIQILNSAGQAPANNIAGSVYSVKAPDRNMARRAGEWQSYYIKFTAPVWKDGKKVRVPKVSVWHNGSLVQKDVEIPNGTTSGAPEGVGPGPILLQDHGNSIRFRRIWIKPTP